MEQTSRGLVGRTIRPKPSLLVSDTNPKSTNTSRLSRYRVVSNQAKKTIFYRPETAASATKKHVILFVMRRKWEWVSRSYAAMHVGQRTSPRWIRRTGAPSGTVIPRVTEPTVLTPFPGSQPGQTGQRAGRRRLGSRTPSGKYLKTSAWQDSHRLAHLSVTGLRERWEVARCHRWLPAFFSHEGSAKECFKSTSSKNSSFPLVISGRAELCTGSGISGAVTPPNSPTRWEFKWMLCRAQVISN